MGFVTGGHVRLSPHPVDLEYGTHAVDGIRQLLKSSGRRGSGAATGAVVGGQHTRTQLWVFLVAHQQVARNLCTELNDVEGSEVWKPRRDFCTLGHVQVSGSTFRRPPSAYLILQCPALRLV